MTSPLQRAQEIQERLLLFVRQLVELADDSVRLRARAGMLLDGLQQVQSPPVMQKEQPLADAPQGGGTEFVGAGPALADAIRQPGSHVVQCKVGEGMILDFTHARVYRLRGAQGLRVAQAAPHPMEHIFPVRGVSSERNWL